MGDRPMPWLETDPMDQRVQFLTDHRLGFYSMTELGARYGISRKTGYQCLDRFEQHGRAGLGPRSRAPHSCPHRIAVEWALVDERQGAAGEARPLPLTGSGSGCGHGAAAGCCGSGPRTRARIPARCGSYSSAT